MQNFAVRLLPVLESKMRDSRSISSRAGRLFSEADGRFIIGHLDADKRYHVTILRTTETDVKGRAGRHVNYCSFVAPPTRCPVGGAKGPL